MDRKKFIIESGRWTILALLVGLVWILIRKGKVSGSYACAENRFCKKCKKFGSCSLPQAIEQA